MPPSRCSSSSSSRSERSSRSRSASLFLLCHQFMSVLLGGAPHHSRYSFSHLPFGTHPSSLLQTMQRGVERAVLHLQELIRSPLNVLPDLVTVSRSVEKRPQDEHVQRSLEEPDSLLRLLRHRRHSTLNLATMVDTRLSIVNGRDSVWIFE